MAVTFWTYFYGRWHGIHLSSETGPVTLDARETTDEGWTAETEVYDLDTDNDGRTIVTCDAYTDGRDCDGRMATEWHGFCYADELASQKGTPSAPGLLPKWRELRRGQRDYEAESAGY